MIEATTLRILIVTVALMLAAVPKANKPEQGFVSRSLKIGATEYRYQVFVPSAWTNQKRWPVILFLHGAGERGSDNEAQVRVGLGTAIKRDAQKFPCVVVMPQCPGNRWWPEPDMLDLATRALDQTITEFNGDSSRVYLSGISMGGYGTWALAAAHPQRFAALAPVCGGVRPPRGAPALSTVLDAGSSADPYADVAAKIGKIPAWIFHGGADPVVPVEESRRMVDALKAAGGSVRYSEYEGVSHNSWDRAYAEPDFVSWLLSHVNRRAK
jgi:predicted peptidase